MVTASERSALIELIARQIAVKDGLVWHRLLPKRHAEYRTLATNILATVERVVGKGPLI